MFKNSSSAFKITFIYFVFSLLWIYFSDQAISIFVKDLKELEFLQTIKGWLFITFSSTLLYFYSKKLFYYLQKEKDELSKVNELLEKIFENAPTIIFWKDKEGKYLGCNSRFLELMNIKSKDELIGKKDSSFDVKENSNYMNDDLIIMKTKIPKLNYIETITVENSKTKILNTSKVPLYGNDNQVIGVLGVITDITEITKNEKLIKLQENLLIEQSKHASMGEMIANIAHQWKQPLSVISLICSGIKLKKELKTSDEESEKESLDLINENISYLSQTIDDFRNFFKKDDKKLSINTNSLLNKTIKLTTPKLKIKNVNVIKNIDEFDFESFESKIIQILINLINNAVDAFKESTNNNYIFINIQKLENEIYIEVKDNAGGIKEEILSKIFEPYFTTKNDNEGTGIGLFMCNEIATKYLNGTIKASTINYEYDNESYLGAQFILKLPI